MNKDKCPCCGAIEHTQHKMSCNTAALFDAYLTIRDTNQLHLFTDEMLEGLFLNIWGEQTDRRYRNMFDEENKYE